MQGNILSLTSSVDLPDDIVAIIESTTDQYFSWDASVSPSNSSPDMDLDQLWVMMYGGFMPDTERAYIRGYAAASTNLIPSGS